MKEFEAMGLAHYGVGHNAFTACVPRGMVERPVRVPRKVPKRTARQKTIGSLESFDERRERLAKGKARA